MAHSTTRPRRPHALHSAMLMQHAKDELEKGDLLQAAEKTWGAFAHAVKDVANQRHWEYRNHGQINAIVEALVNESGERQLASVSGIAQRLHRNYYDDELPPQTIGIMQQDVESVLARLREISRRYRTDPEYREYADTLRPPNSRYDLRRHQWERITPRRRRSRRPTAPPNGRPQNGQTPSPTP